MFWYGLSYSAVSIRQIFRWNISLDFHQNHRGKPHCHCTAFPLYKNLFHLSIQNTDTFCCRACSETTVPDCFNQYSDFKGIGSV